MALHPPTQSTTPPISGQLWRDHLSPLEKTLLIKTLYKALIERTASLEEDNLGADAFYLVGAIVQNSFCEWGPDRPFVVLLRRIFGTDSIIWLFIQIEPEGG